MATVTITATNICSGGNHVLIRLDVNSIEQFSKTFLIDDLTNAITAEEARALVKMLVRLHKIGKTNAQVKTDLQLGLNVVV